MANTKKAKKATSAAKQARGSLRRRSVNQSIQTAVKSSVKKLRSLVTGGKKEEALKLFPGLQSEVDRAAKKGVLHRNAADRYKKRISALLKKEQAKA